MYRSCINQGPEWPEKQLALNSLGLKSITILFFLSMKQLKLKSSKFQFLGICYFPNKNPVTLIQNNRNLCKSNKLYSIGNNKSLNKNKINILNYMWILKDGKLSIFISRPVISIIPTAGTKENYWDQNKYLYFCLLVIHAFFPIGLNVCNLCFIKVEYAKTWGYTSLFFVHMKLLHWVDWLVAKRFARAASM